MSLDAGMLIAGRYELGDRLGAGGMATVYLAHDNLLDREVAIKVLDQRYAADPSFVERFRREASAAAALGHPNIVAVYDRGEVAGTYYIVMEYIDGPDLKEVIRREAPLPADQAVDYTRQILAALGAAHRRGIVHRDVKPQNVMVGEDGRLKVTDFGIARAGAETGMTEAGSVIGTAQYLSPEQAKGDDVTPSSDCYAAGIVLYEMLTGRVPFDGERPVTVAMKQLNEPPVPPRVFERSIPPALEEVVLVSLAKRPRERFESAEAMSAALAAAMGDPPTGVTAVVAPVAATQVMRQPTEATRVVAPPPDEEPPSAGRRWPIWVAALLVLALVGVAGAFLLRGGDGGATTVTVPDLRGQQVGDAVRELQALGLGTSRVDVADSGQEPNTVVGTDPAAGTDVEEGSTVTLRVAAGPDTLSVPDVRNEPIDDARRTLTTAGFEVAVTRAQSETVDDDLVISQDPGAGAEAAAGSTVQLRVSSGAGTVEVPDVTNQDRASAASELEGAGLVVGSVTNQPDDRLEPGTVISQDPSAGSEVDRGSSVNLVVAIEPADVTVPDVVGSDAGTANSELSAVGLVPISEGTSSEQPEGTVLSQSPGGGASARPGSTVRITVSLGPTKDEEPAQTDPATTPAAPPATTAPGTTTDENAGQPLP